MQVFKLIHYVCFVLLTSASYAYISSDVDTFRQTNICVNCDLTRMRLDNDKQYMQATLTDGFLTNANLRYLNFKGSNFTNTNLVRIRIYYSEFSDSNFTNINLSYGNLSNSQFDGSSFFNINFTHTNLSDSDFENSHFSNVNFNQSEMNRTDFSGCNFEGASFKGANMDNAIFLNTNITQQQLDEAKSYQCAILPDGSIYNDHGKVTC